MRRGIGFRGVILAFILAGLFFVPSGLWLLAVPVPGSRPDDAPLPSLATIQAMSELAAIRVEIQDTLEGENNHYQGRWLLYGEAILGIDLSKISYAASDPAKRRATLRLPSPHLVSTKVDHERSVEVWVKLTALLPLSDRQRLRDEAWKMADRKLQRIGQGPEYVERAKSESENVLRKLFEGMGWTVAFQWQDDPRLAAR